MVHYWVYQDTIEPRAMKLVAAKKRAAKQFEGDMIREAFVQEAGEEEAAYVTAMSLFTMLRDDGETQHMLDEANATNKESVTFTTESGTQVTVTLGPVVEDGAEDVVNMIQEFAAHVDAVATPAPEPSEELEDIWSLLDTSEELSSTEFMRRQLGLAA